MEIKFPSKHLTRRDFLKASTAGFGTLVFKHQQPVCPTAKERPNILFVLTNDQRFDMLGCAGNPIIKTPNIDRLAREGVRLEKAFVTSPICAASRTSIFTGTYERTHTYTFTWPPLTRAFTDLSFPFLLRQAGYRVGLVGKLGIKVEENVEKGMFDYIKLTSFPYFQTINGVNRHLTEVEGEYAVEFLNEIKTGQPFCLCWCPWAPYADDNNPEQYFWPPAVDELYRDIKIPVPEMAAPQYYDS